MKSRVFFLGLLGLLWIGAVEASVDAIADELSDLLTKHPITASSSLNDHLALLKKVPEYFKEEAKELIPFKEAPIARPSLRTTLEAADLTSEDEGSPRSPVAVATTTEIIFYNEEDTVSYITQLCFPAAASHYEQGIRALFRSGKPPKHNAKHLTEGLQCLGSKMLFARALVEKADLDVEVGDSLQMAAINQLLNFHRPTLVEHSPDLVSAMPTRIPGCSACLGLPKLTPK